MKRDGWIFELPAKQLADAAKAKQEHHTARLEFWQQAQSQVIADVREKGISVEQSLAGDTYSNRSSGYGPQIAVDQTYQRKLNEAAGKIEEHRKRVAEYDGWLQVLTANDNRTYPLNADDYLFFFGK